MLDFTLLPQALQYALTGMLFIAVLAVFLLLIYKYISTGKFKSCIADAVLFSILLLFISYVAGS